MRWRNRLLLLVVVGLGVAIGTARRAAAHPMAAALAAGCEDLASVARKRVNAAWPAPGGGAWVWTATGFWRWDGCRWHDEGMPAVGFPQPRPNRPPPTVSLWASGPSEAWVVSSFELFHFARGRWQSVAQRPADQEGEFRAVWGTGPNDVRALATPPDDSGAATLYRWNGRRLVQLPIDLGGAVLPADLRVLGGTSAGNAWLAGGDHIVHRVRGAWRLSTLPGYNVRAVWGTRTDDLWAVGLANGSIVHFDGDAWDVAPARTEKIVGFAGTGAQVFGLGFNGAIYGRKDGKWAPLLSPTAALNDPRRGAWANCLWSKVVYGVAIVLTGADRGIAFAGDDGALLWDGRRWAPAGDPTGQTATSVWESPTGAVWATTAASWNDHVSPLGGIMRLEHGTWRQVFTTAQPLLRIAGHDGRVWAAGKHGTLISCTDDRCEAAPSPTNDDFVSLWEMNDAIWAAGQQGTILEWNGSTWSKRGPPVNSQSVTAIWGRSRIEMYAATGGGVQIGDSMRWSSDLGPCGGSGGFHAITAIAGTSRYDMWAAGTCELPAAKDSISAFYRGTYDGERPVHTTGPSYALGLYHHDEFGWKRVADEGFCSLLVTPGRVWAGGGGGRLFSAISPRAMDLVPTGTTSAIRETRPSHDGRVWIVGGDDPVPLLIAPGN